MPIRARYDDQTEKSLAERTLSRRGLRKQALESITSPVATKGSAPQPGKSPLTRKATIPVAQKPKKPNTDVNAKSSSTSGDMTPESERDASISETLMKARAMVPSNMPYSGTVQGILGGASIGLDFGNALREYRAKKAMSPKPTAEEPDMVKKNLLKSGEVKKKRPESELPGDEETDE